MNPFKKLEHEGGEAFSPEIRPNRTKVKKNAITLKVIESAREKSLAQKQEEYLDVNNEALWDEI